MGPLVPRPIIAVIALSLTAGILVNMWRNPTDQNTAIAGAIVAGILGFTLFTGRSGGGDA